MIRFFPIPRSISDSDLPPVPCLNTTMSIRPLASLCVFAALAMTASAALADTAWTATTGNWLDPNNWSAGVPQPDTSIGIIGNGGTAQVSAGLAQSHSIDVGSGGPGAISIQNAGTLAIYLALTMGRNPGDVGNIRVDGANSSLRVPTFGAYDSFFLVIGKRGVGNMTVVNGATVYDAPALNAAFSTGSLANIVIDGAGSAWNGASSAEIGDHGSALLTVRNGATFTSTDARLAVYKESYATALVDGVGSSWTNRSLTVGKGGNATLHLHNGSVVSVDGGAGTTLVAANSTSTGTIDFGGAFGQPETLSGSLETASINGGNGVAQINFNRPGTTTFSTPMGGTLSVAKLGTTSTLTLDGIHTYTGITNIVEGTLVVQGTLGKTPTTVQYDAKLEGTGSIGGPIVLQTHATLSPGLNGPGVLTGGSLEWIAGGLVPFQLGADESDSDLLALSGAFIKHGTGLYRFDFSDGNAPPALGTYTLITFANSNGFSAGDFSFTYSGSLRALNGTFELTPNALLFRISALPVRLQSFEVE
jgi:T5SS/PEP-CTERM-associated repeat protein/autotransporter-associated beta strand protein